MHLLLGPRVSLQAHRLTPILFVVRTLGVGLMEILGMLLTELCIANATTASGLTEFTVRIFIESRRMFDRMSRLFAPINRMQLIRIIVEPERERNVKAIENHLNFVLFTTQYRRWSYQLWIHRIHDFEFLSCLEIARRSLLREKVGWRWTTVRVLNVLVPVEWTDGTHEHIFGLVECLVVIAWMNER